MDVLYTILTVLVVLTLILGLYFSFRWRVKQKTARDVGVSSTVQKNPIAFNPVFWAYLLFAALFFLLVWAFKMFYRAPF